MFTTYISCPVSIDIKHLKAFSSVITSSGGDVKYWERGTTYRMENTIKTCDAFVLILPNLNFSCSLTKLPPGCSKELNTAIKANRPIFIAYKTVSGEEYKIYEARHLSTMIEGISGTSHSLHNLIVKSKIPLTTITNTQITNMDTLVNANNNLYIHDFPSAWKDELMKQLNNASKSAITTSIADQNKSKKDRRLLLML